ncbi:MAG TPA: XdhC family protein [Beijerinckia sp.]|nr:XdhC family protein [Beijerinckia sp.]
MNAELAARRTSILVTDLGSGEQRLVGADAFACDPLRDRLQIQLRQGASALIEYEGQHLFLEVHLPPPRLVVIGAVHISQALAPIAKLADFDMIIVDPRTAFATPERFGDTQLIAEWPQTALPSLQLDSRTAMALLTHDPRIDDPALIEALRAGCFYIGALGSRTTHGKRLERMRAAGFSETMLAQIHAPIGLDLGAVSPAEIAVSIMAEIIAALRGRALWREKAA